MSNSFLSGWALTLLLTIFLSALITMRLLFSNSISGDHEHHAKISAWLENRGVHSSFLKHAFEGHNITFASSNVGISNTVNVNFDNSMNKPKLQPNIPVQTSNYVNTARLNAPAAQPNPSIPIKTKAPANAKENSVATNAVPEKREKPGSKKGKLNIGGPLVSPGTGTDVITNPQAVLGCFNQTQCITPELKLDRSYKVYFCKHIKYGVRFFYLAREGVLLHPNIIKVADPFQAELVVYLPVSSEWDKSECRHPDLRNRTIVLDEGDWPDLFVPEANAKWMLYFKRSYVRRKDGIFKGYMNYLSRRDVLPMTYPVAEAYVRMRYSFMKERDVEILCTLRDDPARHRVRGFVQEYVKSRGLSNVSVGEVNSASRTVVSAGYFKQMYRSRIIITSNPSGWEGDFRLCEALASGALIFVDHMFVPRPNPFIHDQHIVYYDNNNKEDLFNKLDKYRNDLDSMTRVASQGYLHAMTHHRAVNLLDYVLRTVAFKLEHPEVVNAAVKEGQYEDLLTPTTELEMEHFANTGYDMRNKALTRAKLLASLPKNQRRV